MTTRTEILTRHNLDLAPDDELFAEIEVPVLTEPQRQGDVAIFNRGPLGKAERAEMIVVPRAGLAVVRGEATGNTHMLSPDPEGDILWAPAEPSPGSVTLGILHVANDATAWLIHTDEHSVIGIGPGTYAVHGKRTQREEIIRVQD